MGTLAELTAVAVDQQTAQAAVEAGYARLEDVNRLMSDYRDDSEIGRLNSLAGGGSLAVSPETFFVLQRSLKISETSAGAFDITCRPLVELWKQAGKKKELPDALLLKQTLARVGWGKVQLNPATRTVTLSAEGMQLDVGGIAKGYALDLAAKAMRKAGATAGLIDIGGDVLAIGRRNDGTPWRIGIKDPFNQGLMTRLAIIDKAVATSGNQQRFYLIEGKRYSHIVDPRTGWPAEQAPSVTVIASDGITADAWATVFSVLSVTEGQAMVEHLANVEVMWVWGSAEAPQIAKTSGFDQYLID